MWSAFLTNDSINMNPNGHINGLNIHNNSPQKAESSDPLSENPKLKLDFHLSLYRSK